MHPLVLRFHIAHLHYKCLPLGDNAYLHSERCQENQRAS